MYSLDTLEYVRTIGLLGEWDEDVLSRPCGIALDAARDLLFVSDTRQVAGSDAACIEVFTCGGKWQRSIGKGMLETVR